MPGLNKSQPANATEMLSTIAKLKEDVEQLRPRVATGEVDAKDAIDRILRALLDLALANETVLRDFRKRREG